jgi:hypothetical protein
VCVGVITAVAHGSHVCARIRPSGGTFVFGGVWLARLTYVASQVESVARWVGMLVLTGGLYAFGYARMNHGGGGCWH